jgi:hypothetical protein
MEVAPVYWYSNPTDRRHGRHRQGEWTATRWP